MLACRTAKKKQIPFIIICCVQESMAGRALEKEIDMRPMGGIGAVKQERVVVKKEE